MGLKDATILWEQNIERGRIIVREIRASAIPGQLAADCGLAGVDAHMNARRMVYANNFIDRAKHTLTMVRLADELAVSGGLNGLGEALRTKVRETLAAMDAAENAEPSDA
jgi:hypothetical protein